jgi:hypothetical protein
VFDFTLPAGLSFYLASGIFNLDNNGYKAFHRAILNRDP